MHCRSVRHPDDGVTGVRLEAVDIGRDDALVNSNVGDTSGRLLRKDSGTVVLGEHRVKDNSMDIASRKQTIARGTLHTRVGYVNVDLSAATTGIDGDAVPVSVHNRRVVYLQIATGCAF